MRKAITQVAMAVAAAAALSMVGGISAGAARPDGTAATLAARAGSARALQPAAAPGAQLWVHRWRGAADFNRVAASPDGSMVFVLAGSHSDYATIAYDEATGAQLWSRRYNGPAGGLDEAWWMAVSPDGSKVFVTGSSQGSTTGEDYATVAYNAATGARLWARRYNSAGNGDDFAYSVAASPDSSKVFVTGGSQSSTTGFDYATVAYNAATGARLWARRYNSAGNGDDLARSVAASPDGSKVFVTGTSREETPGSGYATVAYSAATGTQLWARRPANGGDAESVAASPDGTKVFVSGTAATVAYDAATGAQEWGAHYAGGLTAYSMAASPDGTQVFVTGLTGSNNGDYATIAYNAATGAQQWAQTYNGPGNGGDWAYSVALSPSGSTVYVTGNSQGEGTGFDYATIAYNAATGAQQWAQRYNGPANAGDWAYSVAASPEGNVFVTGNSQYGPSTTIAYKG